MIFSAVLFDMDGVVVDTQHSVSEFWFRLAAQHQVELTPALFDQHIYGVPALHTLKTVFTTLTPDEVEAVLADLADYEAKLAYSEIKGVTQFLRNLKQHHIPTALVTSAQPPKVRDVVDQLGLDGLFTAYVTASDIQKGKPAPDCYLLGAQRLGIAPENCVVFEDAINGVKAAVAAGTYCVGIRTENGAALTASGAQLVIPDFTQARLENSENALFLRLGSDHTLVL